MTKENRRPVPRPVRGTIYYSMVKFATQVAFRMHEACYRYLQTFREEKEEWKLWCRRVAMDEDINGKTKAEIEAIIRSYWPEEKYKDHLELHLYDYGIMGRK